MKRQTFGGRGEGICGRSEHPDLPSRLKNLWIWKDSWKRERVQESWGKIWERFGEPKKKEEGGGREMKKSIKVMLGPDTPEDTTPSIPDQEDGNGRRKTPPQGLLGGASLPTWEVNF